MKRQTISLILAISVIIPIFSLDADRLNIFNQIVVDHNNLNIKWQEAKSINLEADSTKIYNWMKFYVDIDTDRAILENITMMLKRAEQALALWASIEREYSNIAKRWDNLIAFTLMSDANIPIMKNNRAEAIRMSELAKQNREAALKQQAYFYQGQKIIEERLVAMDSDPLANEKLLLTKLRTQLQSNDYKEHSQALTTLNNLFAQKGQLNPDLFQVLVELSTYGLTSAKTDSSYAENRAKACSLLNSIGTLEAKKILTQILEAHSGQLDEVTACMFILNGNDKNLFEYIIYTIKKTESPQVQKMMFEWLKDHVLANNNQEELELILRTAADISQNPVTFYALEYGSINVLSKLLRTWPNSKKLSSIAITNIFTIYKNIVDAQLKADFINSAKPYMSKN